MLGPVLMTPPGAGRKIAGTPGELELTDPTFSNTSPLFYMPSRFVVHLLISWLQSPSTVIWEPKKIKSVTVSIVSAY